MLSRLVVIAATQETNENQTALGKLDVVASKQVLRLERKDMVAVVPTLRVLDGVCAVSAQSATRAARE